MKTIIIYNDTLRRDYLKIYNEKADTITPNIDDFSKDSITFDNHFCGSMPCMPARRDFMTGKLNFLERSWGPIEINDVTLPKVLEKNNIKSHIITDHAHYFRIGGENYCQSYSTYEFFRGQESDPWISYIDNIEIPKDYFGKVKLQYECNRTKLIKEEDYSSVKCFNSALDWLDINANSKNDFLLTVETFDPHEPFDVPKKYLNMYNDNYTGPRFDIPNYSEVTNETDEAIEHIKNRYKGLITMLDCHFGDLIKKLKEKNIYEDTMIILTTDHGYCFAERNLFGKNYTPYYNELVNIPLLIHMPKGKYANERRDKITQAIDLMPTILQYNNIQIPESVKGISIKDLIEKNITTKKYALYGTFGLSVNIYDGEYTYFRGVRDNKFCYEYTTSPTTIRGFINQNNPEDFEAGKFLKNNKFPVYKTPILNNPITNNLKYLRDDMLFNIKNDYGQKNNIKDKDIEKLMAKKLVEAMIENDAPQGQFERLDLNKETIN